MHDFKGKIVFITGAGSGIGLALAKALIAEEATVIATDIDEKAVKRLQGEWEDRVAAWQLDVRDAPEVKRLFERLIGKHGRIDYLFNNAGIGVAGEAHEIPLAYWNRIIDINIRGVVNCTTVAYPIMVKQRSGHIINTASVAGLVPVALLTPYTMTKHAIVGLSTSLRIEAAAHGVKVSAICPAAVETPLLNPTYPADLPSGFWIPNVRRYLTKLAGAPYSAEKLAADVLRGIRANKRLIIAPARARLVGRLGRFFPSLVEMAGRSEVAAERKTKPGR